MTRTCERCGSTKNTRKDARCGLVVCGKHREQFRRFGFFRERTSADPNEYVECDGYVEIILRNLKQDEVARTKIDAVDVPVAKRQKWCLSAGYAGAHRKMLHREIMGKKFGHEIDHINGDKLDNRRANLRFVTHRQNTINKPAKGVSWNKYKRKWCAYIATEKCQKHLGCFKTWDEAKKVRAESERSVYGGIKMRHLAAHPGDVEGYLEKIIGGKETE